jgi:tetratricopeptide (TPR) repeat protein
MGQATCIACPIYFSSMSRIAKLTFSVFATALLAPLALAQSASKSNSAASAPPASATQRAIELAHQGDCSAALPLLRSAARSAAGQARRDVLIATLRCALKLDNSEAAINALLALHRDFPHDPEVLYVTTHAYSDLATRTSQELARTAPDSYPAQELYAEALEAQGKWNEAALEYKKILAARPNMPGIHYRLGRLLLSEPPTASTVSDATKEFEAELKLDPKNADAEYILGELARNQSRWEDAVVHFSRAAQLDPGFAAAYLALGMSLNSANKFADSVAPLEKYVRLEPDDPAGHYQLAIACARTGRREEAEKQMALQRDLVNKSRAAQGKEAQGAQPH